MSDFHFTRIRTRESISDYDPYYLRPLIPNDFKSQRKVTLSDDCPYSSSFRPPRTFCTLTPHDQPSQLERYNIWSDQRNTHSEDDQGDCRRSYERRRIYKYTNSRPTHCYESKDDLYDPGECDFQLKVQAKFSRPKSAHHHHESIFVWPTDVLRRKEKCVDENWELRERSLSRESWSRYRRVKRTKTERLCL
ncbi:hypothetical protein T440DRAFT_463008 [Plenodomus tracheiphilus IPT5]|uniref:Uncharacterized protein n=1 Tax=Plenodomus tracheiphilus IPT5 TaxID=1408161 RepID=A0A6A7BPH0_9PLEO|nr:hypothetical protein T440DRAFT_463008 [Plenodomus tracheiphilus IPT5]